METFEVVLDVFYTLVLFFHFDMMVSTLCEIFSSHKFRHKLVGCPSMFCAIAAHNRIILVEKNNEFNIFLEIPFTPFGGDE